DQSLERFQQAAESIGYPVLLKASAGGGGRGMQVVENQAELAEAFDSAKREAKAAFGNDHMLLEKYVLQPRHVEVQIVADTMAIISIWQNVIALFSAAIKRWLKKHLLQALTPPYDKPWVRLLYAPLKLLTM